MESDDDNVGRDGDGGGVSGFSIWSLKRELFLYPGELLVILVLAESILDNQRPSDWPVTRAGGRLLIPINDTAAEGKVSLTGGPHLNPMELVCPADGILSSEDEAVVPGVLEDVGHVQRCAGHQHRVALSVLHGEACRLEAPAHLQRGAREEQVHIFRSGL